MNYIVFDLEFNQGFNFGKGKATLSSPSCPFEIIHLGAVKLDENLNIVGKFDSFIKPKIYLRLHPYVKKMTGITKADMKFAEPFSEVYCEFIEFIGVSEILGVWGTSDIKELLRNIEYHKLDISPIPKKYIDIQHNAGKHFKHPKGTSIGLESAAKLLNIPIGLEFHNAFNDAFYTAEIFKRIYSDQIKPEMYNFQNIDHTDGTINPRLDTDNLIKQFEKMYQREMTNEEKSIIKLAYNLGYTKQFQKTE